MDIHLNRAFAGNAAHIFGRVGQIRAHRIGQAHPHRALTARIKPLTRPFERIKLGGKHLMLADVGRDDGVVVGYLGQSFNHHLRQNDIVGRLRQAQTIARAPAFQAMPPFFQMLAVYLKILAFPNRRHLS